MSRWRGEILARANCIIAPTLWSFIKVTERIAKGGGGA